MENIHKSFYNFLTKPKHLVELVSENQIIIFESKFVEIAYHTDNKIHDRIQLKYDKLEFEDSINVNDLLFIKKNEDEGCFVECKIQDKKYYFEEEFRVDKIY